MSRISWGEALEPASDSDDFVVETTVCYSRYSTGSSKTIYTKFRDIHFAHMNQRGIIPPSSIPLVCEHETACECDRARITSMRVARNMIKDVVDSIAAKQLANAMSAPVSAPQSPVKPSSSS